VSKILHSATLLGLLFMASIAHSQCNTMFIEVDVKEQCSPASVRFVVVNAVSGSTYTWNFGNGQKTGTDTMFEFFTSTGFVDVKVDITFPNGNQCVLNLDKATYLRPKPIPAFTVSEPVLCDGPGIDTFTCTNKDVRSISWIIDGTNYNNAGNKVKHRFKTPGSKKLSLIVVDSFGCRGVKDFTDVVRIHNDVDLYFTTDDSTGCAPKTFNFTPTVNPNGEKITSYRWSFSGSNRPAHTGLNPPSIRYAKGGNFNVSLTARTDKGCVHKFEKRDLMRLADTTPIELIFSDTAVCAGIEVTIRTKDSLPGTYVWELPGARIIDNSKPNERIVSYSASGHYDVGLNRSFGACGSKVLKNKAIRNGAIQANIISNTTYDCVIPTTCTFETDLKLNGNTRLEWKVIDKLGNVLKTSENPLDSVILTKFGYYTLEITATNGQCTTVNRRNNLIRVDHVQPTMGVYFDLACINQNVQLDLTSHKQSWQVDDTVYWKVFNRQNEVIFVDSIRRTNTSFDKVGFYDVQMFVGNSLGCLDSIRIDSAIEIIDPIIQNKITNPILCRGGKINLESNTSPYNERFVHKWHIYHAEDSSEYNTSLEGPNLEWEPDTSGEFVLKHYHSLNAGCLDSIIKKDDIKVNVVRAKVKLDTFNGCSPFPVHPTTEILRDLHLTFPYSGYQYSWSALPNAGFTIDDSTAEKPEFTFNERGKYVITLKVTNSAGCINYAKSDTIYVDVIAKYDLSQNRICFGVPIDINDRSELMPTDVTWSIESNYPYTLDNRDTAITFTPLSAQNYTVTIIADKFKHCFDTFTKVLTSVDVNTDFTVVDDMLYCAPAYGQFEVTSTTADTFQWHFGDGNSVITTDLSIANVYEINSGSAKGFTVSLISTNTIGCKDTLIKPDAIKIIGPVPKFTMDIVEGCEPLRVRFTDLTTDASEKYMNFNDGTALDRGYAEYHTYTVKSFISKQTYYPELYTKDTLGCAATFIPEDSIQVYRTPVISGSILPNIGCLPLEMDLQHNSATTNTLSTRWNINGDSISNQEILKHTLTERGKYDVQLIISNDFDCADTLNTEVNVLKPYVSIRVSDTVCLNKTSGFVAKKVFSEDSIVDYSWDFGEATLVSDIGSGAEFTHIYTTSGDKEVQLISLDTFGCRDTALLNVEVLDPKDIPVGEIEYTSVRENGLIEVHWNTVDSTNLSRTHIRMNGMLSSDLRINSVLQTEISASTSVENCFELGHLNNCDETGVWSTPHCPVVLNIQKGEPFELNLSWTAYKGWNNIDRYEVLKSENGTRFEILTTVDASTLFYTDTLLCDQPYCYKIRAINNGLISTSNSVCEKPNYKFNEVGLDVSSASVVDNKVVQITWERPLSDVVKSYKLLKYNSDESELLETKILNQLMFQDSAVSVSEKSYVYRVKTRDHCLVENPDGLKGKTILLSGFYSFDRAKLEWSPYEEWDAGVKEYQIELLFPDGFRKVGSVPGTTTVFEDLAPHEEILGEYFYRIKAISPDGIHHSLSNVITVIGDPEVYIPNAFSPNGDGLNDEFKPYLRFVQLIQDNSYRTYEMSIYSRWGEKVFTTSNVDEGWDGTSSTSDQETHTETFMYVIRVTGINGDIFDLSGSIHILR
jgi:gliding motility-associated-like protein